jgi:hypothetical protein
MLYRTNVPKAEALDEAAVPQDRNSLAGLPGRLLVDEGFYDCTDQMT